MATSCFYRDIETNHGLPEIGKIVESICATAYTDGKTEGVYAVALTVLPRRLYHISQKALADALVAGIGLGWLRQGTGRIELTAAGIYIAKVVLGLPT
jgi:hypothetical protein